MGSVRHSGAIQARTNTMRSIVSWGMDPEMRPQCIPLWNYKFRFSRKEEHNVFFLPIIKNDWVFLFEFFFSYIDSYLFKTKTYRSHTRSFCMSHGTIFVQPNMSKYVWISNDVFWTIFFCYAQMCYHLTYFVFSITTRKCELLFARNNLYLPWTCWKYLENVENPGFLSMEKYKIPR